MTTKAEPSREQVVRQALEGQFAGIVEAALEFLGTGGCGRATETMEAEQQIRSALFSAGAEAIRAMFEAGDWDLREILRERFHRDPHGQFCHGSLKSKGRKFTTIMTLFGPIRVRQWTAACRICGRLLGTIEQLFHVVGGMTPACANAVTLAGVTLPYEQAKVSLQATAGLKVDQNRVKSVVDAIGPHAKTSMEKVPESRRRGSQLPPERTRVYVMVDGGRIRFRGEGGGGLWREPCTSLVFWEGKDGKLEKRGMSHPTDKGEVLGFLDRWMEQLSFGSWEVVIVGDGADWIWQWAAKYPWAIAILDYYHLKEHVYQAAAVLHGQGTPQASRWADEVMNLLWRNWPHDAVAMLDRMRPSGPQESEKRKAVRNLANYINNHADLIRPSMHDRRGRFIGSGAIESICKQLFSMRMKGPGMFWSEEGAAHVMALRTLYITGQWEQLWNRDMAMSA
jgi:hypothetical protein